VLRAIRVLCIASAAVAACALVPAEAEAKGCNDHLLTKVYSSQNRPNQIPKTRRVSSRRKKNVPLAHARPVVKPAIAQPVVRVHAVERTSAQAFFEELDLAWVGVDFLIDDQRSKALPQLIYNRYALGLVFDGDPSPIGAQPVVSLPAFFTPVPLRI
jgi:hypothetical protein